MQRTVLLLDGSEAINSSSDYLPSYLLAIHTPIQQFVTTYLESTPLASLGVVVMRDGISHRLSPCTTNTSEILHALERDYFLAGGSGTTSLENGLRMSLAELVDLKRSASADRGATVQLRIVAISASVTLIDPTDVFKVARTLARFRVAASVISFPGAVYVYQELAHLTGGMLYCPLNYQHLQRIVSQVALGKDKGCTLPGQGTREEEPARVIPIGFPVYVDRPVSEGDAERYLACPQCGLLQTSIPSTCSLCKLLLCGVTTIYPTFVKHNELLPPCIPSSSSIGPSTGGNSMVNEARQAEETPVGANCCLCAEPWNGREDARKCTQCHAWRCAACQLFCRDELGLCPTCVSLR